jgi:hypothetical protein
LENDSIDQAIHDVILQLFKAAKTNIHINQILNINLINHNMVFLNHIYKSAPTELVQLSLYLIFISSQSPNFIITSFHFQDIQKPSFIFSKSKVCKKIKEILNAKVTVTGKNTIQHSEPNLLFSHKNQFNHLTDVNKNTIGDITINIRNTTVLTIKIIAKVNSGITNANKNNVLKTKSLIIEIVEPEEYEIVLHTFNILANKVPKTQAKPS